jgi:hypothetical protein
MAHVQSSPISLSATAPQGVTLPPRWFTCAEQHRTFQHSILEAIKNPPEWFSRRGLLLCDEPTLLTGLPEECRECISVSVPENAFKLENLKDYGSDPLAHNTIGRFQRTQLDLYQQQESCHAPGKLLIPSPLQVNHLLPNWSISAIGSYGDSSLKEMLVHLMQGRRPVALFYPGASNNLVDIHHANGTDPICAYFHDLTHLSYFRGHKREDVQRIATRLHAHYNTLSKSNAALLVAFEKLVLTFCDGLATDFLKGPAHNDRAWERCLTQKIKDNL